MVVANSIDSTRFTWEVVVPSPIISSLHKKYNAVLGGTSQRQSTVVVSHLSKSSIMQKMVIILTRRIIMMATVGSVVAARAG